MGWDLCLWEGAVKKERFPYTGKYSHWQECGGGELWSLGGKTTPVAGVQKAKLRGTCTEGWCQPALCSLRLLSTCLLGWVGAGCCGSGFGGRTPGRGVVLAVWRQPEGARLWSTPAEGVWEEAWVCQRGKRSLSGGAWGPQGWAYHVSFFLCALVGGRTLPTWAPEVGDSYHLRSQRLARNTTAAAVILWANATDGPHLTGSLHSPPLPRIPWPRPTSLGECLMHVSLATTYWSLSPQAFCISAAVDTSCASQLWPPYPSLAWAKLSVPQSAAAFAPSCLVGEQMPENGPHTETGSKPKLNPRCGATKEEEQKSLYSCTSCRLNPHNQPGKPCICGIFEWKMSAPTTEPSLTLAAVDFGGKHTSELSQVRV